MQSYNFFLILRFCCLFFLRNACNDAFFIIIRCLQNWVLIAVNVFSAR